MERKACCSRKRAWDGQTALSRASASGCRTESERLRAPLKGYRYRYGYIYIDIDIDLEVDVDTDGYFGSLKGASKSVQRCSMVYNQLWY